MTKVLNQWLGARLAKPIIFFAALLPFGWLILAAAMNWLGANPAEALERSTGTWTLRMLCVVLAVTPVRTIFQLSALARFRRMMGLFVYFYAMLHAMAYSWFDMGFEPADIAKDIVKRPFILIGFSALVLLTPLAFTSFNRAIKALGAKRWQMLHQAIYAIAVMAIIHFFWMRAGKHNFGAVAVYAAILGSLLGWRLIRKIRKNGA